MLERVVQQTVRGLLLASLHPRTLVSIILQADLPQYLYPGNAELRLYVSPPTGGQQRWWPTGLRAQCSMRSTPGCSYPLESHIWYCSIRCLIICKSSQTLKLIKLLQSRHRAQPALTAVCSWILTL